MANTELLEIKSSRRCARGKSAGLRLLQTSVFFDFDNTLTSFDVLDEIIKNFAIDDNWRNLEKKWLTGEIGSKECLEGQLDSVRVSKKGLFDYLSGIEVDSYFKILVSFFKDAGVKPIIVSDSFYPIINFVFKNNGIRGIKIYANAMKFHKDRLKPSFPYADKLCQTCANCKKNHLEKNSGRNFRIIYIGDGRSDVCPAERSDLVFAKAGLGEHFKKNKRPFIAFKDLSDVYRYFKEANDGETQIR